MSLIFYKYILTSIILLCTLLAGLYPFYRRGKLSHSFDMPRSEALAAGVFLGAGLMHMLVEAGHGFRMAGCDYPWAAFIAGLGFLLLLSLEHICQEIRHHYRDGSSMIVRVTALMISIHSLLAGIALGLGDDLGSVSIIFLAIIGHKWAESFALSVELNREPAPLSWRLLAFTLFSLMTPAGILLGTYFSRDVNAGFPILSATFTSLSAGTFIYIGTLHRLSQSTMIKHCCNLREFVFVILGFLTMSGVAYWL